MTTQQKSAVISFAGVLALIIGFFNFMSGLAAVNKDDVVKDVTKVLFDVDLTAWGWVWIVLGALQIIAGILLLIRNPIGFWMGLVWATINAVLTVFVIFVFPLWAIMVITVDIVIIKALIDNSEEFGIKGTEVAA